ncbi:MAG TPA: hypothetical protein VGW40_14220 [Allosphingosinicella sp.]|nr:hypothetical protein [Allosphingosinicella sp.]
MAEADLGYVALLLSAACHIPSRCSEAMILGKEMVEKRISEIQRTREALDSRRQREDDRRAAEAQRQQDLKLWQMSQLVTILATVVGALIGVAGVFLPGWIKRWTRRRRRARLREHEASITSECLPPGTAK